MTSVNSFFKKNKKAVSGIVVTMILIALVVAISSAVYTLTRKTVQEKIKQSESCGLNLIDKISLNNEYTCYDSINQKVQFSINVGDIEVEEILISIETETDSEIYVLNNEENNNLGKYGEGDTIIPEKKSGKTYIANGFNEKPTQIQIAPKINGKQCGVVDSINNIILCL